MEAPGSGVKTHPRTTPGLIRLTILTTAALGLGFQTGVVSSVSSLTWRGKNKHCVHHCSVSVLISYWSVLELTTFLYGGNFELYVTQGRSTFVSRSPRLTSCILLLRLCLERQQGVTRYHLIIPLVTMTQAKYRSSEKTVRK